MYRDPGELPREKLKRRTPMVLRVMAFIAGATLTVGFGGASVLALVGLVVDAGGHMNRLEVLLRLAITVFCGAIGAYGIDLMIRSVTVRSTDSPAMMQKRFGRMRIVGALIIGGGLALPSAGILFFSNVTFGAPFFVATLSLGALLILAAGNAIAKRMKADDADDAAEAIERARLAVTEPSPVKVRLEPPEVTSEDIADHEDHEEAANRHGARRID